MSEMSVKEAYKVLQAECGIETGDKVKVLRMYERHEMGCALCVEDQRRMKVGDIYFAEIRSTSNSISLRNEKDICVGFAPFFALELVEKAKPELPPIMVGNHEVEFLDGEIEVGCETVSKETLLQILERLEN